MVSKQVSALKAADERRPRGAESKTLLFAATCECISEKLPFALAFSTTLARSKRSSGSSFASRRVVADGECNTVT
jgi:hypothetical protein